MNTFNRHKLAFVTWAVAYLIITALLGLLEPFLSILTAPLKTLLLTTIMVPTMIYVAMPFVTRHLAGWLNNS